MAKYPNIQPLGEIKIVTVGTTVLLSTNCGAMGGSTVGTPSNPPLPGSAFRGIVLQAPAANTLLVYLLPRGKAAWTAGSPPIFNPADIIAVIAPGATVAIPYFGVMENGILPENFCLDTDTGNNVVFGYGIF